ncbi:MAG: cation:proton antiporter [Oscillospiraceae bacterium]|nr:cation:proton antiporter [Oscillospiraceae bacterium]
MIDKSIFLIIALILLSTKALAIFVRYMHLPQVIGALVAGVLLGPSVFHVIEPNETISVVAEFGVILLLFSAGMETDYRQFRSSLKSSLVISALGIAMSLVGVFAVAFWFGNPSFESFFIGVIFASMSTSITVEVLQEMGKLKSKVGTALLGAALFDDIFVIVILAIIMGMESSAISFMSILVVLLKMAAFFAFAVASGLGVNRLFNYMYGKFGGQRRQTVFAIAYCFLMAYAAEMFGLADITGAYIAGIAFCSTRCVEFLETRIHGLLYMFFTPIFFANIGIHTSFSGMTGNMILFTVFLVVVAIFAKVIGCGLGSRLFGFSTRESLQVGTGMVARGEVSFIVAYKGIAAGYIGAQLFPSIVVVVLVTVLISPLLLNIAFAEKKSPAVEGE